MKTLKSHPQIERPHCMKNRTNRVKQRAVLVLALVGLICELALPGYCWSKALSYQATIAPMVTNGSWSFTSNLNTARYAHTAALLANGKVLVAGGGSVNNTTLTTAELYDPETKTWSATGDLNSARRHHTSTLLLNGKVLVVGGSSTATTPVTDSAELYNPDTGSWTNAGKLNNARYEHTATLLENGKVLVAGGSADGSVTKAELYDPDTNTWSVTGDFNIGRFLHTATLLQDGKVLVAGGTQDDFFLTGLASAELYNPDTGTWSVTSNLSVGRQRHTATLLPSGKVLIANGGIGWVVLGGIEEVYTLTESAEIYDPAAGTWSKTGDVITAREGHRATLLQNGAILVVGGWNEDLLFNTEELYDPDAGKWSSTGALNIARNSHTATLLPNGKVLAAGGRLGSNASNSAELYDPAAIVTPRIFSASVSGKRLVLRGENFDFGAVILLNGQKQKTLFENQNPRTALIGKNAGKRIKPGDRLQVRNPNGTLSEEFIFTGS